MKEETRDGPGLFLKPWSFNTEMTVAQMIDIVSFLQSRYEEFVPEYDMDYFP